MRRSWRHMRKALLVTTILMLGSLAATLPAASALEVATRGTFLRGSDEYGPGVWDEGYMGCGVTIAIFDNGVDDRHPWLDGKVVAGVDVTATQTLWTLANGGNPQPLVGSHGTPVAGMAASHFGMPFNAPDDRPDWPEEARLGSAPCAWMVDVMFQDIPSMTTSADMVTAFDWAIEHRDHDWGDDDPSNDGIDIITMSWSPNDRTDGSDPVCEAANRAAEAGIIVLGSAGNSGNQEANTLGCPTGADGALSIANAWNHRTITRDDDEIATSSSWGPRTDDGDDDPYEELKPDVAAPGMNVISTNAGVGDGSEYQVLCLEADANPFLSTPLHCSTYFGGTSAATPFVAGTVAVLLQANPNLTVHDVREILHQSAVPFPGQEPSAPEINAKWHEQYGFGLLDAKAALALALTWPGLELGRDRDSDGVRDYLDAAPMDPAIATSREVPPTIQPAGGNADSDGDGVPDASDAAPLDPQQSEAPAMLDSADTPGPGLVLVAAAVAAALVVARRRQ